VIELGVDVDSEGATAAYEDGMLLVELPLARQRTVRSVPVQGTRRGEEA
jgi:HSP20 family molecular chaperone IbpA